MNHLNHHNQTSILQDRRSLHTLASQRFQIRLTLFPKCFAPFPHGTCLLSSSIHDLASDEIYHHIRASIPRSATLAERTVSALSQVSIGTFTLPHVRYQGTHTCADAGNALTYHNARRRTLLACHYALFPFRSPLLRISCPVSIPLLTYMLKFSN